MHCGAVGAQEDIVTQIKRERLGRRNQSNRDSAAASTTAIYEQAVLSKATPDTLGLLLVNAASLAVRNTQWCGLFSLTYVCYLGRWQMN